MVNGLVLWRREGMNSYDPYPLHIFLIYVPLIVYLGFENSNWDPIDHRAHPQYLPLHPYYPLLTPS